MKARPIPRVRAAAIVRSLVMVYALSALQGAQAGEDPRAAASFGSLIPVDSPMAVFTGQTPPLSVSRTLAEATFFSALPAPFEGGIAHETENAAADEPLLLRGSLPAGTEGPAGAAVDVSAGTRFDPLMARGWELTSAQTIPRRR